MTFTFTWLGHSTFVFNFDDHIALIDPFLTDNPLAAESADVQNPEIIFLSHAHGDHSGDVIDIAKRSGAKVVANFEIGQYLAKKGLTNIHQQNPGGGYDHGFVHCRFTMAHHSSSFPDGTYGGEPNGFIFTTPSERRIYFAGDTCLFRDMELIGDYGIDVAFLPIGDNYTMGPEDSIRAIHMLRPRLVVPMHYNTFDVIVQDVSEWARQVNSYTDAQPVVLDPGNRYVVEQV